MDKNLKATARALVMINQVLASITMIIAAISEKWFFWVAALMIFIIATGVGKWVESTKKKHTSYLEED